MNLIAIHYLNLFLIFGSSVLFVLSIVALFLLFLRSKQNAYLDFIDKHFLTIGFIISTSAAFLSLVYSEVINFLPCYLCWFQRVFIFPLPFIFGSAIWHKERMVVKYVLPLLSVGAVISIYQNFIYYFTDSGSKPCDASGISCFKLLIPEFNGYIQIPTMALVTFGALITVVLVAHFYKKED